tara:strand:- start:15485 stop:15664 length:180 start_codon:yes stop_codon:yes gene_type:complete
MKVETKSGQQLAQEPFIYYKRNGNVFHFKNENLVFKLELSGIDFYNAVDVLEIGDSVTF